MFTRHLLGPYISVLYRAHLCMKYSIGISDFLEEIMQAEGDSLGPLGAVGAPESLVYLPPSPHPTHTCWVENPGQGQGP